MSQPSTAHPERRTARQKLLAAADELFYGEGVQTVGIDRVIERAGVARASLYNVFGSKQALVRAYLESRHAATVERLTHWVEQQSDPRARLLAVFESQAELFAEPGFHGCAFARASAEAPEGGPVEQASDDYRTWVRKLFTVLANDAGAADPALLAIQLQLLYDGAGLSARMDRAPGVSGAAKAAAAALLDASIPQAAKKRSGSARPR